MERKSSITTRIESTLLFLKLKISNVQHMAFHFRIITLVKNSFKTLFDIYYFLNRIYFKNTKKKIKKTMKMILKSFLHCSIKKLKDVLVSL